MTVIALDSVTSYYHVNELHLFWDNTHETLKTKKKNVNIYLSIYLPISIRLILSIFCFPSITV